jgi:hypothetical protein
MNFHSEEIHDILLESVIHEQYQIVEEQYAVLCEAYEYGEISHRQFQECEYFIALYEDGQIDYETLQESILGSLARGVGRGIKSVGRVGRILGNEAAAGARRAGLPGTNWLTKKRPNMMTTPAERSRGSVVDGVYTPRPKPKLTPTQQVHSTLTRKPTTPGGRRQLKKNIEKETHRRNKTGPYMASYAGAGI